MPDQLPSEPDVEAVEAATRTLRARLAHYAGNTTKPLTLGPDAAEALRTVVEALEYALGLWAAEVAGRGPGHFGDGAVPADWPDMRGEFVGKATDQPREGIAAPADGTFTELHDDGTEEE